MVYAQTAYEQYGLHGATLLLTNLYGPEDHFGEETSHVVPVMIKKVYGAKLRGEEQIYASGNGSPSRTRNHDA